MKKTRIKIFTDDLIEDDLGRGGRPRSTTARRTRIRGNRIRIDSDDDDESDEEIERFPRPSSDATPISVKEYNKAIQNIRGISSLTSQRREMVTAPQV